MKIKKQQQAEPDLFVCWSLKSSQPADTRHPFIDPMKRTQIFREAELERENCNYWWHDWRRA